MRRWVLGVYALVLWRVGAFYREWTWSAAELRRRRPRGARLHWTCCDLCPAIHHTYRDARWHFIWLHLRKRDYFRRPPWVTGPSIGWGGRPHGA